MKFFNALKACGALLVSLILFACTMEPKYKHPENPLESKVESIKDFKYAEGLWKEANPSDDMPKGKWWALFNDENLNELIENCREKNPTLKSAFYAVEQARQKARMTASELSPWVDGSAGWSRTGSSKNEAFPSGTYDDYRIGLGLTWDLDLFGRVQALLKSDKALAQAQFAAYNGVMLMLESEVANTYFDVCQCNSEIELLKETVKVREAQVKLVSDRLRVEYSSNADLKRSEQQYYEAITQLAGVSKRRDTLVNYLAYITGEIPAKFKNFETALSETLPEIPKVIPSMLLERRPDIAELERKLYAANFRIGSANSAFFPTIQITSSLDLASADIDKLMNSGSLAWGVSPRLYIPIFQAGRLIAQREVAFSEHAQIAEQYKEKVLFAIFEVENSLSIIKNLKSEYEARAKASDASKEVKDITYNQFKSGIIDYFEFTDAERVSLVNERERIRLRGDQFRAIVSLYVAIGGSPTDKEKENEGQKINKTAEES